MSKDVIIEDRKPESVKESPSSVRNITLKDFMKYRHGSNNPLRGLRLGLSRKSPHDYYHNEDAYTSDIETGTKVWAYDVIRDKWRKGEVMNIMWEYSSHKWLYQVQFEGDNRDIWTAQVNKAARL